MKKDNFFDVLNEFDLAIGNKTLSAAEIALFTILLIKWNKNRRSTWFDGSTQLLAAKLGLTTRYVRELRNSLKQKGLIDFKKKSHSRLSSFHIKTRSGTIVLDPVPDPVPDLVPDLVPLLSREPASILDKTHAPEKEKEKEKSNASTSLLCNGENSKLYNFIRRMLGKNSIGILKRSNIPLELAAWLIGNYQVMAKKHPVFYLIALSKREDIVSKWRVLTNERFKESEVKAGEFGT